MSFEREPAVYLRAISAILALVVGIGVAPALTENTTQLIIAFIAALLGVWQAFKVRPVVPSVLGAAIAAGAALLAGFDVLHVTEAQTALTVAAVEAALALVLRPQSTPVAAPGDKQATVG